LLLLLSLLLLLHLKDVLLQVPEWVRIGSRARLGDHGSLNSCEKVLDLNERAIQPNGSDGSFVHKVGQPCPS
jgi:hypothetical protein